jgi:hypothetical protein
MDLAHGATAKVVARVTMLAPCDGTDTLTIPIVVD